jgi:6-pyruvoyltetrahydropterin/6-carboxytetrahydropterin synthase
LSGFVFVHSCSFAKTISAAMLRVTKIFRFETAHAIFGYAGSCRNIHGHSYVLHVTVQQAKASDEFIVAPGFVIDFKELKAIVKEAVIDRFDHRILLSEAYLNQHPHLSGLENLELWKVEPTAENILLQVKSTLQRLLPATVELSGLKLYETADSYAEWIVS